MYARPTLIASFLAVGLAVVLAQPSPTGVQVNFEFKGEARSYLLHRSSRLQASTPSPLVIVMHPADSNAQKMLEMTGFADLAEREGFTVAFTQSAGRGLNAFICCGNADDVGYVKAVVASVSERSAVDKQRVYATGISNGGDMAFRLAIGTPEMFAAIAPVSGGLTSGNVGTAGWGKVSSPVSIIAFHGESDRWFKGFETGINHWRETQKCVQEKVSILDAGRGIRQGSAGCADGSEVVVYRLKEMGHAWPGGRRDGVLAFPNAGINATELIWAFFKTHPKRP